MRPPVRVDYVQTTYTKYRIVAGLGLVTQLAVNCSSYDMGGVQVFRPPQRRADHSEFASRGAGFLDPLA